MEKGKSQYVDQELLLLIGDNLKRFRKSKQLSQRKLAWDCNTDESTIRRIEQGKINTTVSSLKRIADCLEVPVEDFFKTT